MTSTGCTQSSHSWTATLWHRWSWAEQWHCNQVHFFLTGTIRSMTLRSHRFAHTAWCPTPSSTGLNAPSLSTSAMRWWSPSTGSMRYQIALFLIFWCLAAPTKWRWRPTFRHWRTPLATFTLYQERVCNMCFLMVRFSPTPQKCWGLEHGL